MSPAMLSTKLFIPPPRPELVPRPRLTERLNDGLTRPLTLISAPPGFGKTTVLTEWHAVAGHDIQLAWLSLDADDNDPVRFLTYFIAALETLRPGIGSDALAVLQSPQPPSPTAVLTALINSLIKVPAEPRLPARPSPAEDILGHRDVLLREGGWQVEAGKRRLQPTVARMASAAPAAFPEMAGLLLHVRRSSDDGRRTAENVRGYEGWETDMRTAWQTAAKALRFYAAWAKTECYIWLKRATVPPERWAYGLYTKRGKNVYFELWMAALHFHLWAVGRLFGAYKQEQEAAAAKEKP